MQDEMKDVEARERMAEIMQESDAVLAVAVDAEDGMATLRDASSDAELAEMLWTVLTARGEAREFLDAVSEKHPEAVQRAEEVYAGGLTEGRR